MRWRLLGAPCYGASTTIVLTATPAAGGLFAGWGGACSGTGACAISMNGDRTVSATFTPLPPPSPPAIASPVPSISGLAQSAVRWREGSKLARISATKKKPPLGTTFSFTLNEATRVTFSFTKQVSGRNVHGRCVPENPHNTHRRPCVRTVAAGALGFGAHKGVNKVFFAGRLSRTKRLGLGSYTFTVTAVNAAGKHVTSRSLSFTIVK